MDIFFYTFLFIFGTIFGSFSSVIIYRIKSGEGGIMGGRSHCTSCSKTLKILDLIPIISYIINKGACRYCKKKVSNIYPFLEISTGILFTLIGYFLIDFSQIIQGNYLEIIKLIFFLIIGFITIIYTFYDILFLEIPESVLAIGTTLVLFIASIQTVFYQEYNIAGIIAVILSILIIIGLYIIMLKGLKEIWDIIILLSIIISLIIFKYIFGINLSDIIIFNSILGTLGIFIFFYLQILISKGEWMGGGDLRIAILIGLILGYNLWLPGLMITYLYGSIIGIGIILYSKVKQIGKNKTTFTSQIPFGPFLALGFFTTIFYQNEVLGLIKIYFG